MSRCVNVAGHYYMRVFPIRRASCRLSPSVTSASLPAGFSRSGTLREARRFGTWTTENDQMDLMEALRTFTATVLFLLIIIFSFIGGSAALSLFA